MGGIQKISPVVHRLYLKAFQKKMGEMRDFLQKLFESIILFTYLCRHEGESINWTDIADRSGDECCCSRAD